MHCSQTFPTTSRLMLEEHAFGGRQQLQSIGHCLDKKDMYSGHPQLLNGLIVDVDSLKVPAHVAIS